MRIAPQYGYQQDPPDAHGVIRVRTDRQVRLSIVPRDALERTLHEEFGGLRFPGLYLLVDSERRLAYVGESADLRQRLRAHVARPPKELAGWDEAVLVGDGRPMLHSILNDAAVRQHLERGLIDPLRAGASTVVNKVEAAPPLNYAQKAVAEPLAEELTYVLSRLGLARELPRPPSQEEMTVRDIEGALIRAGHEVGSLGAYEAAIDGQPAYIRPGSLKPRGWQITLRNRFRECVRDEDGYLLVSRGRGLLIPFSTLREFWGGALEQKTVDIFVTFESDAKARVNFKKSVLDVCGYLL